MNNSAKKNAFFVRNCVFFSAKGWGFFRVFFFKPGMRTPNAKFPFDVLRRWM